MRACADLAHPLSLRNILPEAEFFGSDDIAVTACCRDWRAVRRGSVFVALKGPSGDGHRFIAEAIARGCIGVVAERPVLEPGVPVCYVSDVREAYGRICHALAGNPSRHLKVIGIAGRDVRTPAACLVASVLTLAGRKVGVLGALGYFDGQQLAPPSVSTPPADELAPWLARMLHNGCTHAVVEVSERALEQGHLAGIALDAACLTRTHQGPLGLRPGLRREGSAPSRLLRHLSAEGLAVVNADDPGAASCLGMIDGPVLTVAMAAQAEITATWLERHVSEQTILLSAGSDASPVRMRMIGTDLVYCCLTAAAIGLAYGIDLPAVVRGIEAIDSLPGRLERIECGQPFSVFVDRAHTPGPLAARLRTLREVVPGRVICVFGARGDGDRPMRARLGRTVEEYADLAILTDDDPQNEDPQTLIEDILSGLKRPADAEVIPDRAEAIHWALGQARPGDAVLVAGTRSDSRPVVGPLGTHYDDRQLIRGWLYAHPGNEVETPRL